MRHYENSHFLKLLIESLLIVNLRVLEGLLFMMVIHLMFLLVAMHYVILVVCLKILEIILWWLFGCWLCLLICSLLLQSEVF